MLSPWTSLAVVILIIGKVIVFLKTFYIFFGTVSKQFYFDSNNIWETVLIINTSLSLSLCQSDKTLDSRVETNLQHFPRV